MGKREMDDEQRKRMRDLKHFAKRASLSSGAFLICGIFLGLFVYDDWTAYLGLWGALNVVPTLLMVVSDWRYIRRGPFPRLPASMQEGDRPQEQ